MYENLNKKVHNISEKILIHTCMHTYAQISMYVCTCVLMYVRMSVCCMCPNAEAFDGQILAFRLVSTPGEQV